MKTTKDKVITESFLKDHGYDLNKCIASAKGMLMRGGVVFYAKFMHELSEAETASSVSAANRCGKLYHYKYQLMLKKSRPTAVNLALGTLVHNGLEYYWGMIRDMQEHGAEDTFSANSGGLLEALDLSVENRDNDFWSNEKSDIWKCQAIAMLRGYYSKYLENDKLTGGRMDYHAIRPEFSFIYISDGGKLRIGKMDVVMLRGATHVICMEHKTTSDSRVNEAGADYWSKLFIDTQLCFYREAIKRMYPDRQALVIYDVLRKTSKKPLKGKGTKRKDESPEELAARKEAGNESLPAYTNRLIEEVFDDEMYVRKEIPVLNSSQKKVSQEIDLTVDLLGDKRVLNRRNPTACTYYNTTCDFIDVCTEASSIDDRGLFQEKTAKHEEIEETL